jgi:hypothetical protein
VNENEYDGDGNNWKGDLTYRDGEQTVFALDFTLGGSDLIVLEEGDEFESIDAVEFNSAEDPLGDAGNNLAASLTYNLTWDKEQEIFSASANFTIFFVPVTISAGLVGEVSFSFNLTPDFSVEGATCNNLTAGITGTATPAAGLSGFASAGVGASGMSVGLRVDLLLAEIGLPVSATVEYDNSDDVAAITTTFNMTFQMKTLDGSVNAYAEFLGYEKEQELFKWSGPSWNTELIDAEYVYPIAVWSLVCEAIEELCK